MEPQKITGFAWYKEGQYQQFRKLCKDGMNLPKTHTAFVEKAQRGMEQLKRSGIRAVKVEIDIGEFRIFCRNHGYKLDSDGRIAFVNHTLHSLWKSGKLKV